MRAGNLVKYWVPVILWMLIIFTASTDLMSAEHTSRFIGPFLRWFVPDISVPAIVAAQFFIRKLAHLTEYAILAALLVRALRNATNFSRRSGLILALLIASSYAMLDEFHQSFVRSRTASSHDVLIDICGALLGLAVWWGISRQTTPAAVRR